MVKEKTGRAMQEKERERKGKNGKTVKIAGCSPIREGVLLVRSNTTLADVRKFGEECQRRWGITPLQIFLHKDEGHWLNGQPEAEDRESFKVGDRWFKPNYHAHIVFDWMNHETGKSRKLNDDDMMQMQTLASDILLMERGQSKAVTGKEHLERNDFIIEKQKAELQRMDAAKAVQIGQVAGGVQQLLAVVLAVYVQQAAAQLPHLGHGDGPSVQAAGVAPVPLDLPLEQQLLPLVHAVVGQPGQGRQTGEHRRDQGGLGPGADELPAGPLAQHGADGVDDDGLARPRLAGEDVQPAVKADVRRLDDGDIFNVQQGKHGVLRPSFWNRGSGEQLVDLAAELLGGAVVPHDEDARVIPRQTAHHAGDVHPVQSGAGGGGQSGHGAHHHDVLGHVHRRDALLKNIPQPGVRPGGAFPVCGRIAVLPLAGKLLHQAQLLDVPGHCGLSSCKAFCL